MKKLLIIREQITPKGDGNFLIFSYKPTPFIREQITPKGDGNQKKEEI